jgi:crotonobetainyl-CoA:carnitine CoA-transferase CaiB-like acyl-CoA transferase
VANRGARAGGAQFEPLAGVRVLDVTTSLAGPYCTLILSSLGADIVKVEHPVRGDDTRAWGPPFWNGESAIFLAANAGKRSLAVDLKRPEGLEAVLRVAERSDVLLQNLRPGLADRLGIGFDAVSERSPRIVYCSIGAFGKRGPLRDQPGYDPLMQAAGGIMSVTGEVGRMPVRAGVSVIDQGTGMWSAIAILAALRARDQGAAAQLVDLSLYETAVNWLPYQVAGYLGSGRVPQRMGTALGIISPYQTFEASDGWVMIAAGNDRQFEALSKLLGRPELADDERFRMNPDRVHNRDALSAIIQERFRGDAAAVWLERLTAAGVPAAPVLDVAQVVEHPQTEALALLQALPHPAVPDERLVGLPISVGDERLRHRSPAPSLGQHTADVLREAGYTDEDVERLAATGVVCCGDGS